jgi:hypothetical protein
MLDCGSFLQFFNPIHSQQDSLNDGSAQYKTSAETKDTTYTEWTDINVHASSGIRINVSVWKGEDISCFRPLGHCYRLNFCMHCSHFPYILQVWPSVLLFIDDINKNLKKTVSTEILRPLHSVTYP